MAVEDRAARRAAAAPAAADADHVAPAAAAARPGSMAERRTSRPRTVLVVASFGVLMAFIDATIVNVAFPEIQRSFPDAGFGTLSWVLNAYNIFFAAFLVAAGRMADLLGRKRVFELGIALFTSMSVLCAIAPTVETLIAARILQAVGAAIVVPASLALVLEAYPGATRRHGVAAWSAVSALAAGLGPALGGLLIEIADWRLVFLVNLPIGVAAWLLSRRHLVESRAAGRRRVPDLAGALVLAAAIGALTLGLGDGWVVLPGTHSKWVLLQGGRVVDLATYMTGELFALLTRHGTLASVTGAIGVTDTSGTIGVSDFSGVIPSDSSEPDAASSSSTFASEPFLRGVHAAGRSGLSNALFGCRALVVTGRMPASDARDYLSGLLIGAEWHDVVSRHGRAPVHITLIGSPELERRYAGVASGAGCRVTRLSARDVQLAAFGSLRAAV